ncbi:MAG: hypothetical protein U0235_20890 [Polyangiaceae bacterium]
MAGLARVKQTLTVAVTGTTLVGAIATTTPLATSACADRVCEPTYTNYGGPVTEGNLIDANTWESTANDGKWIPYPGQRTYFFYPHGMVGRRVESVLVWISPSEEPNLPGNQYSLASGNAAVVTQLFDADHAYHPIAVHNDTCADFFVRVEIKAYPEPVAPGDAGADAGANDGAITSDASTDGASE